MSKIAWIGTGVMGASMAKNLLKHRHEVYLFNKTQSKAERVKNEAGGVVCTTINETVQDVDYIFTIVGYPNDVEEVYLAENGILKNAKRGALAIDMTTSKPSLAKTIYNEGKKLGIRIMDAPVSGGDMGARNGTLSIMVGGDPQDFDEVKPLLDCMGKNVVYLGPAGNGQHTKAANQIAVAGATAAMTEAIVYALNVGLDHQKMLEAIGAGAAGSWQITNMAPRVLRDDLGPGFFIKHFIKDMKIIKEEMAERGISLEMLNTVLGQYEQMAQMGFQDNGTQALIKLYK